MTKVDCIVIGGGVIGLAVARTLSQSGREVIVLEAERDIGQHTSSRNSEVIHAGIYYPENSLKALLCRQGKDLLYEYCDLKGISYRKTGKLIVATSAAEIPILEGYKFRARNNGVHDIRQITAAEARELEPSVLCEAALLSPSTGIFDSHAFMLALSGDLGAAGCELICNSRVSHIENTAQGFRLEVNAQRDYSITCNTLINSAGLWAPDIAGMLNLDENNIPKYTFARGHYFTLAGKTEFSHLIYPVPSAGGLGIHLTMDLGGQVRFGPDVEWIKEIDYSFTARKQDFLNAIKTYYPAIEDRDLKEGYTGIRPRLGRPDSGEHDFQIQTQAHHQTPGLINLFGIESPGLTASLALARSVGELVKRDQG